MTTELFRKYTFSAAHALTKVPDGHKCKNVHGHNFVVIIRVRGDIDRDKGWVMDFATIDRDVEPLVAALDHRLLNELIDNPTSERIAQHFLRNLTDLPGLHSVEVQEEPDCGANVYA